jgi:uncharacterized protein (DUF1330 family)
MRAFFAAAVGAALGAGALWSAQQLSASAEPAPEKPAFLVVLGEVKNREAFMAGYVAKLPPVYAKYGGEYLALGRNFETLEGKAGFQSVVISKWPSMDAGRSFWNSSEYKELQKARIDGDWGRFDVFLVEGLPVSAPK